MLRCFVFAGWRFTITGSRRLRGRLWWRGRSCGLVRVADTDDAVGDGLRGFLEVLAGEDVRDRADVVAVEARVPVINYWRELGTNLPQEDLNTLFTFLSHGSKQVILLWTENGFDKSPAALVGEVGAIVDHSVSHFLPQTKI